jgi:hypothetical protein
MSWPDGRNSKTADTYLFQEIYKWCLFNDGIKLIVAFSVLDHKNSFSSVTAQSYTVKFKQADFLAFIASLK